MAKAKIITDAQLDTLLDAVATQKHNVQRDFVVILLSCKAGLRACEIAGLTWNDVTDVTGGLATVIEVPAGIAKKGRARVVPMHPLVHEALALYRAERIANNLPHSNRTTIIRNAAAGKDFHFHTDQPVTANGIRMYMKRLYEKNGLNASSHSGRRAAITAMARNANMYGCSLFDVQRIAGHSDISTTEAYVEFSDGAAALVGSL
jgi:integrase/recombinase XerD